MKNVVLIALFSFLGGLSGALILQIPAVQAQVKATLYNKDFTTAQFFNNADKRVAFIGNYQESGGLFLFDQEGKTAAQMGAYGSGAEKGQTLFGLHDRQNQLRYLTRLYGQKDSPTIIMKDGGGYDRLILGLDGATQMPFIKYLDDQGEIRDLIKQVQENNKAKTNP
ncbi:MAG: hypothetical protein GW903_02065 [Alphaproteobacteria bacterium]|nr:hypothetical protein [Alphaproteobacteria bacterium]NCQ87757.1 hypothetical protein [Alphaproteobacteria bacterium]NCT05735.1 hypothetical protein [Alphaproteobacteria bacterium]